MNPFSRAIGKLKTAAVKALTLATRGQLRARIAPESVPEPKLSLLGMIGERSWYRPTKKRRGISAKAAAGKPYKRRQRLKPARGPGSINCEAEAIALAQLGRYTEALALVEQHDRIRGATPLKRITKFLRFTWAQHAERAAKVAA